MRANGLSREEKVEMVWRYVQREVMDGYGYEVLEEGELEGAMDDRERLAIVLGMIA